MIPELKMKKTRIVLISMMTFVLSTCNVIDPLPEDRIDLDVFYSNAAEAESGLIGVYVQVFQDLYVDFLNVSNRASGDLTAPVEGVQSDVLLYRPGMTAGADGGAGAIWDRSYKAIAYINLLVEKVPQMDSASFEKIPAEDFTRRASIIAEARFMRAFVYYYLVQYFGDVPLITKFPTNSDPNENKVPRANADEVWTLVKSDLEFAEKYLPWNHNYLVDDGASQVIQSKGRATRGAAKLLLARIQLLNQDWAAAANQAVEIINDGGFTLAQRWITIFDAEVAQNSTESILEIQTKRNEFNNTGGYAWFHQDGRPRRGATLEAFNSFDGTQEEPVDVRKVFSLAQNVDNPTDIYVLKYRNGFPWWDPTEPFNFVLFRLTEAYLIYAEALNELSGGSTEALRIVNQIRARSQDLDYRDGPLSGINPLKQSDYSTKELLREAIRDERRRELMFEGLRWFDLLRYDTYDNGNRALNESFLAEHFKYNDSNGRAIYSKVCPPGVTCEPVAASNPGKKLLPIPQAEILRNDLLIQNEAYR
jgi:starch-binding outer membrane protein, SusD/RagB family